MAEPERKMSAWHVALRRCAGGVLFAAFVGLFINILHLATPLYMMQVFDRVLNSRSHDTLLMLTLLVCASVLFMTALDFIRSRVFMITGEQLARRLQRDVFAAAMTEALQSQATGGMRCVRDLQEVRQFVTGGPVALPFDIMFTPLLIAVLFLLHPAYGLIALAAIAIMIALALIVEFAARRPSELANEAALQAHHEVNSALRHAEVIEGMGMLPTILRRWQRSSSRALTLIGAGNSMAKALAAISRGVRMWVQVAVIATGAVLAIDNLSSAGGMTGAAILVGRVLLPFDQLIDGWRQWSGALTALGRLRQLLSDARETRGSMPIEAGSARLAIERLTFVPPGSDRPVLRGISFSVEPGDVVGVIGPSGAGKSTLARLLVGLWKPSGGRIFLDGNDVYAWERPSFGRQVGYLPQNPSLLDGTIRENIARMAEAAAEDVIEAAKRADVHEMIGRLPLGYETRIGDSGFVLSGGQRQRVALARALFGGPKLLVLDEPNANLDAVGEQSLMNAIREAKQAGTTVIVIAHRTSIVTVADKLLVLKDGMVEQYGPRAEIMRGLTAFAGGSGGAPANVAALPLERGARA